VNVILTWRDITSFLVAKLRPYAVCNGFVTKPD
jgi:hypothetical protein